MHVGIQTLHTSNAYRQVLMAQSAIWTPYVCSILILC